MLNRLLTFLLVQAVYFSAAAQNPDVFKRISSNEGLSKNSISAIIQDKNDFIWIGTTNGLNRFDGEEFKVFKHNPSDTLSMPSNEVQSLFQSANSDIWIGTQSAGVFKYIPSKDRFVEFDFFSAQRGGIGRVNSILQDQSGTMWFGTDEGILKYHDHKFFNYKSSKFNKIRNIQVKNSTEFWVVSSHGLAIFHTDKNIYVIDPLFDRFRGIEIRFINKIINGNWIIGTNQGAFVYTENKLSEIESLHNIVVNSTAVDLKGNIWIGTNSGLYKFDKSLRVKKHFIHETENASSISNNNVTSLLINRTGILFIGTLFSGVNICNTNNTSFASFRFQAKKNEAAELNNIKSIMPDKDGGFMIGSALAGIYQVKCLANDCEKQYKAIRPGKPVLSAYHARDNSYWIGSFDPVEGTIQMDWSGKMLFNFSAYLSQHYGLTEIYGSCFLETGDKEIWIGTNNNGLFRVVFGPNSRIPSAVHAYSIEGDSHRALSSNKILCLKDMGDGKLWIGTKNGLNILDVKSGRVRQEFYNRKDNSSLGSDKVNDIFKDNDNKIWIGTAGGGLNLVLGDDEGRLKFKRYTEKEGLSNNIVLGILEDSKNNLWISTSYGLNRFAKREGKITNYYQDDGLPNSEFRHKACFKDKNGVLYFGTISGICYFDPKNLTGDEFTPSVKITDFTLFNKRAAIGERVGGRILLDSTLGDKSSVTLRYDENIFGFRFAGLHFASPKYNKFRYRLKGFNDNWIETGSAERSATFTNLSAGKYVFELMASNHYNKWGKPIAIEVIVLPAPWNTWWANLIYLMLIALLAWVIYKIFKVRQADKAQLNYERNQQEIVNRVNKSKLKFFTNISHEFRTPLTLILTPLAKIVSEEKKNSAFYPIHQVMYRNADRLYRLIEQLMDFKDLESGTIDFNPEDGDLVEWIKNSCTSFEHYIKDQEIELVFYSSQQEITMQFDKQMVENMIYNLLSNAVNYTPNGGFIEVRLNLDGAFVHLDVRDNGKIIPEEVQQKIFDRYYTVPGEKKITQTGVGIGLALTKELVELHNGNISLISNAEMGTCFRITLPLRQSGTYAFNPQNEFMDIGADAIRKIPEIKGYVPAQKPVVVIIEDNYDLRTFIESTLVDLYEIHTAENGKLGLRLIEAILPDLVISDIVMPELDGLTLCYRVKSNSLTAHIPVILLTARATVEDSIAGEKTGADDYVSKPFNIQLLQAKCHNLITTRKRLSELFRENLIHPDAQTDPVQYNEFVEKAIKLIEENLSDPELGIEFLTDKMNMSRAQLYRKFKALSNQTVKEFIRVVRLRNAARLIREGKFNVSEICYQTGFSSHSYFSKCFKEIYGDTPKEYAEKFNLK